MSYRSWKNRRPRVGFIVELQVQTEAVADEIEVVTLPRPGAARTATVKSLPVSEPNLQEDETGALGKMLGFPRQCLNATF